MSKAKKTAPVTATPVTPVEVTAVQTPTVIKTRTLRQPTNVKQPRAVVLPTPAMIAAAEVVLAKRAGTAKPAKAPSSPATAAAPAKAKGGLSERALAVLALLAANPDGMTRKQMVHKTGVEKGWSKLLGAATKGTPGGLEGAGLVKSTTVEGVLVYVITAKGRKLVS